MAGTYYDGSIRINTKLNTQGFDNGMQAMQASLGKLAAAVGIAFSVTALVKMGKQAVELASDIQEVDNVVSKSFGNMRGEMDALADTAIEKLGMSRLTAYQTGSTFMAMGKSMVSSTADAKDMALSLTELTGNMSSFYNVRQDVASTALKSIYTGETETLKQFGVVMTETNLQQFAYEQGIRKTMSTMTQSEKVMLRYKYVTEQLSFIGNDFLDTQDSWANQTRILAEQWKELLSILGSGLITVLSPVVKGLNNIVSGLIDMANTIGKVLSSVFGIQAQELALNAGNAEDAAGAIEDYGNATEAAAKKAKNAMAAFDDINVLQQNKPSGSSAGSAGGSNITSSDMEVTNNIVDQLDEKMEKMLATLAPLTEALQSLWNEGLSLLADFNVGTWEDFYNNFLKPVGNWSIGKGLPRLAEIINDFLKKINWGVLRGSLADFYTVLGDFTTLAFDSALDFWEYFLSPMAEWTLNKAFVTFIDLCTDFAKKINWNQFNTVFEKFYKVLSKFGIGIGNGLLSFLQTAYDLLSPALIELIDLLGEGLEFLLDVLDMIPDSVIEALGGALGGLLSVFITYKGVSATMRAVEGAWKLLYNSIDKGMAAIAAHPYAAIAAGIAALVGVIINLADAAKEKRDIELYGVALEDLCDGISKRSAAVVDATDTINEYVSTAGLAEMNMAEDLAEKYYALSEKASLSNDEKLLMKRYAEELSSVLPELSECIDDETGKLTLQRDELGKLIENTRDYYRLQAARDKIIEAYGEQLKAEEELSKATEEAEAAQVRYNEALEKYENSKGGWEAKNILKVQMQEAKDDLGKLTIAVGEAETAYQSATDTIEYLYSILESSPMPDTESVGQNFSLGIATGITKTLSSVDKAAADLADTAISNTEQTLKGAPQKIGQNYVKEFNAGIAGSTPATKNTLNTWMTCAIDPFFAVDKWDKLVENLRHSFQSGFTGITGDTTDMLNSIIGNFEKMANQVNQALNGMIGSYNTVAQGTGSPLLSTVGGIKLDRIPKLAQGAVFRGGNPYLAIVNDQPSGQTNIEAPAGVVKDMVIEGIAEAGGINRPQASTTVILEMDGKKLAQAAVPYFNQEISRIGTNFRKR